MARDAEIEAGYAAFPSPQWVKDRAVADTQWISGMSAASAMSAAASSFSSI
jgi:hypothetical protein